MRPGLAVALVGCAAVVLGCFLPAGEPTGPVLIVRDNTLVQMGGGLWLIGGAALSAWVSWHAARDADTTWHIVVLGLAGLAIVVWAGATLKLDDGSALTPGVGIYVVGLGCALLTAGGAILGADNRKQRKQPPALPEGWLQRPDEPGTLRWWDGKRWTGATRPAESASEREPA